MKKLNGYVAPTGWVLLLTVALVFGVELVSAYVITQGPIAAMGGTSIILSLVAVLSITAIVAGARYRPADQNSFASYSQA